MTDNDNTLKQSINNLLHAIKTNTYFFALIRLSQDRSIAMWTGDSGPANFPTTQKGEGMLALILSGQTVNDPEKSWRVFANDTVQDIWHSIKQVHQSSIVASKDIERLRLYCLEHPEERFWQALANITGKHIWLADQKPDGQVELLDDTYYFEKLEHYEPRA